MIKLMFSIWKLPEASSGPKITPVIIYYDNAPIIETLHNGNTTSSNSIKINSNIKNRMF